MDLCPDYYEQTSTTPADRDPGSLLATFSESKAGISTTGGLLQRDASPADDEMRQSPVRLPPRPGQTTRTLRRVDVSGQRQNRQGAAHSRSDAHVWRRFSTVSKTEVPAHSSCKTVADRPAPSGQAGPIRPLPLSENRGYSHIPPSDLTRHRQRITSPELAHSACVSRRPKVDLLVIPPERTVA